MGGTGRLNLEIDLEADLGEKPMRVAPRIVLSKEEQSQLEKWSGGRGRLPTRGSRISGRVQLRHPAPRTMVSLLNDTHCARRV